MKISKRTKKWLKVTAWVIASPFLLFLLLAVLIYLPPVQNALVHYAADRMSESTGMKVSIDHVCLKFPLDFEANDILIVDGRDTVVAAQSITFDVQLLPLFSGRADIDGFALDKAKVNTKSFVGNTYIRGHVGHFEAASHGIEWGSGAVHIDKAELNDATLFVALSDTAQDDTTASSPWMIEAERLLVNNTRVSVSLPTDSMRLSARLGEAEVKHLAANTGSSSYAVGSIDIKDGGVTYAALVPPATPEDSTRGNGAFQLSNDLLWRGFLPSSGLDPNYIKIKDLVLQADSLSYDSTGTMRVNIRHLGFAERSGLKVDKMSGVLYMDSTHILLPALQLQTAHSLFKVTADVAFAALYPEANGTMKLLVDAAIGHDDVRTLGVGYVPDEYLAVWPNRDLTVRAELVGNVRRLSLQELTVGFPGAVMLTARGSLDDIMAGSPTGNVRFNLSAPDASLVKAFLPEDTRNSFNIPRGLTAQGNVAFDANNYKGNVDVRAAGGKLTARAAVNTATEAYSATAQAAAFPLSAFVPDLGIGPFSGSLTASGRSFDIPSERATMDAQVDITRFVYDEFDLSGMKLDAHMKGLQAVANFESTNELVQGNGTLTASLDGAIMAQLEAELPLVSLYRLAETKDSIDMGLNVNVALQAAPDFSAYGVKGALTHIRFMTPKRAMMAKDFNFTFATTPDTTTACVAAGDLDLDLGAKGDVTHLADQFSRFTDVVVEQLAAKSLDQETLRRAFPVMDLTLDAGSDNPLGRILRFNGITYSAAHVDLHANPRDGISGRLNAGQIKHGELQLDTVHFALSQDTAGLRLDGTVHNYTKRNPNKFEASLNAYLLRSEAGVALTFLDEKRRKGIDLGARASFEEDGLRVSLFPTNPIIAYRNFTVNSDNYVRLGFNQQIGADLDLVADDGTALRLYGEPTDSVNDLTLAVANLKLGELCNVLPYLPRMHGTLNGDFHVVDDRANGEFSTAAQIAAEGFSFEGAEIGNVGMEAIYMPKGDGKHYANAYISADDTEVLQCEATYDDNAGTIDGNANLHDCPLRLLNGFLAGTDVALDGTAGGDLTLRGTTDAPILNGQLTMDTAHVYSDVYGFSLKMDEQPVTITNSKLLLKDYNLYSANSTNPLTLNGDIDFSNLDDMTMDLAMRAKEFPIINAKRSASSIIYGKMVANYVGTFRSNSAGTSVRGKLEILDRTDMTYVLKDSPLTVEDQLSDLVKFVDFSDTTAVVQEETTAASTFDLTLGISVSDAARFCCNLSEDGSSYVNLEGGGDLTFRLTQEGEMRLTGRFTANSGEMKYELPIIPLKTFTIAQGSYVDFTGDPMNPTLNITATERVKATVTESDQPRSVAFDVGVAITQPLNSMGLEFTIEAPEDLTVQNQLATMSREQRSKAAVAMLATGMYLTDELLSSGTSSGFKTSNALNAFLQSEIQNIAGSALKTIDLSVGMESGTSETGTETTDYSFQFSKRFWNNRISVIIGGKVSTGEDATNSAQSVIDNVAIEYRLDNSSTRYVKVFYDRTTQDALEGRLTRAGAALVLRRKTDRLGDLFIFKKKKKTEQPAATPTTSTTK